MRLAGRISDWNDEKGFGFVVPNGGGDRAFVHVNEFQRGSRRPVAGDLISYFPAPDQRGRLKATQIRHAGQTTAAPRSPSRIPRAALGIAALAAWAGLAIIGAIPVLLPGGIVGLSALAYVMYWLDKSAAQRNRQRTPESTLHLVSLAGGWPGALIAQQQFRHKTIKQPFQSVFWVTAAVNVAVLVWLVMPGVAAGLAQSLGH
jgi:uncharacterized membrane protein YsdA (DUF1294 family)/cold shock CspA family protein